MASTVIASKIMIIRHAEKPSGTTLGVMPDGSQDPEALTVQGWQRSGGLVALFDPARGPLQAPELATPGTILASWTSATKGSQRPRQTVDALAEELGLDAAHYAFFDKSDIKGVVDAALAATGVALISWQHEDIPAIAARIAEEIQKKANLPVTPVPLSPWPAPKWPGSRFDLVWVFDAPAASQPASWTFTQVPQLLLPGDQDTIITTSDSSP